MRFPALSVSVFVVAAISCLTAGKTEAWTPATSSGDASTLPSRKHHHPSPQEAQPKAPVSGITARREFVKGSALSLGWCWGLGAPSAARAYERRDVGGGDRSPETAAMNEMAYRTNNRLERAGFQLETAAEQSASLTSALSGMSYDDTKSTTKSSTSAAKKNSRSNTKKQPKKP